MCVYVSVCVYVRSVLTYEFCTKKKETFVTVLYFMYILVRINTSLYLERFWSVPRAFLEINQFDCEKRRKRYRETRPTDAYA